eukprot:386200-Pyramimonas_sp.AAC.1
MRGPLGISIVDLGDLLGSCCGPGGPLLAARNVTWSSPSWTHLGALCGRPGRLLDRIGALLGRFGAL